MSRGRAARKYHGNLLFSEPDHVKIVKISNNDFVNQTSQLKCHELKRRAQNQQSFDRKRKHAQGSLGTV
jgi:hypothetical protein